MALTGGGVLLMVLAPRLQIYLLPFLPALPWLWVAADGRRLPPFVVMPVVTATAAFAAYAVLAAAWSPERGPALETALLLALAVGVALGTQQVLWAVGARGLAAMATGFCAGMALALAVLACEVLAGQPLRRAVMTAVPALRAAAKHVQMEGQTVTFLAPYLLNRAVAMLTLLLWPALLAACRGVVPVAPRLVAAVAFAAAGTVILNSEHLASGVALAASGGVFLCAHFAPRAASRLVLAGWLAATLLVVPIVLAAYGAGLQREPWLPFSAQARVVIWAHTAQQISAAPFFGAGIRAARRQEELDALRAETAPGTVHLLTTEAHAHNVYLQVWYELGAVGALIGMLAGVLVLRTIAGMADAVRPWMLATFVACAVSAAFSFGLWQPWFMAAFAMLAVFATLAAVYAAPPGRAP